MTTESDNGEARTGRLRPAGWVGTGRMGTAMAQRLLDGKVPLTVWNRTRAKTAPLAERGAQVADTLTGFAGCEVVFVTVSTPDDLWQVLLGVEGLLSGPAHPDIVVDCSTVSEDASAAIRAAALDHEVRLLAAPVSGNPHVVAAGGACLVVSGPRAAFEQVSPYFELLAGRTVFAGEGEESRLVKLCHNLYLAGMVYVLAEVTSLAEKGGIDRAAFLDFLNGTVLTSEWVRRRSTDLVALDWTPTFTNELLRKDVELGLDSARRLGVPMHLSATVHELVQAAIGLGYGERDLLSRYEVQARESGLTLE